MKKRLKIFILFIAIAITCFVATFFGKEFIINYIESYKLSDIDIPDKDSKVLVFAPHSDDEVLGSGELIRATLQNGGEVKVVLITNGDGSRSTMELDYFNFNPKAMNYIDLGLRRQQESIDALKVLGLDEKNIIFLGYPDGGISRLWGSYWDHSTPYTSPFTKVDRSPYDNSFTPNAVYSGESLIADMIRIINDYNPTHIIYPHPNDRHPDHWAVNCFVKHVLAVLQYKPSYEWLYLVHRGDWPTPMKKNINMYLVPPAKLSNTGTQWYGFMISYDDILNKSTAIHCYKSQLRTLRPLMTGFERKNELFGVYDNAQLAKSMRSDVDIEPDDGNRLIIDPLKDTLALEISKAADISKIYGEISGTKNLHVFIEAYANIDKKLQYNLGLFLYGSEKISRLDVEIKDGKASLKQVSKQSITNGEGLIVNIEGKIIHIVIPHNITGDYYHAFINAYTSKNSVLIDKTAWRMLDN